MNFLNTLKDTISDKLETLSNKYFGGTLASVIYNSTSWEDYLEKLTTIENESDRTAFLLPELEKTTNYTSNTLLKVKDVLTKDRSVSTKEKDKSWILNIALPIYSQATFTHQLKYTQEPIPNSTQTSKTTMISEFMTNLPRRFVLNGVVSAIQQIEYNESFRCTRSNSKIDNLVSKYVGSTINSVVYKLKTKATYAYTRSVDKFAGTSQAIDVATTLYNEGMDKLRGLDKTEKQGELTEDEKQRCQQFIALIDNLASSGVLFQLYYCGILYSHLAITDIKINKTSTQSKSIDVSLTFEEKRLVGNADTSSKPATISKKTSKVKQCICKQDTTITSKSLENSIVKFISNPIGSILGF